MLVTLSLEPSEESRLLLDGMFIHNLRDHTCYLMMHAVITSGNAAPPQPSLKQTPKGLSTYGGGWLDH